MFIGSVVFYATIVQVRKDNQIQFPIPKWQRRLGSAAFLYFFSKDDKQNWGQSLYGIAVTAVSLFVSLFVALRRQRHSYVGRLELDG